MKIVKSISLLSFLFYFGQNAYSQKQFKTYYDLNNTKVKEVYFTNAKGEKEGVYKLYDENGIIQQEANYKAGVLEGMLKEYYPLTNKACLKRTAIYKNGDVDGQTTFYEEECNVVSAQGNCSRYYLKEGVWVFYKKIDASMPEGYNYITYTQTFQADKMISESEIYYYHPSKKVYSEKKGNKRISYSPDGKIIGEETYDQNGATIEEKVFYISNGKLGKQNNFTTNGNTKNEEYNEWFENGNVRLKKKLENGETVVFEEYDAQGNPTTNMNWYKKDIAERKAMKDKNDASRKDYNESQIKEFTEMEKKGNELLKSDLIKAQQTFQELRQNAKSKYESLSSDTTNKQFLKTTFYNSISKLKTIDSLIIKQKQIKEQISTIQSKYKSFNMTYVTNYANIESEHGIGAFKRPETMKERVYLKGSEELYTKAHEHYKVLEDKYNANTEASTKQFDQKLADGNKLIEILDKLISLANADYKELNKSIKKAKTEDEITQLLGF